MIIPHALANRLNVFQEGRCLKASRASLVASRLFPSFAHLLAPNLPFGHCSTHHLPHPRQPNGPTGGSLEDCVPDSW